jgi:hypothetical protein
LEKNCHEGKVTNKRNSPAGQTDNPLSSR